MKGIIFAAGIGSRLKPFTDSHPKALAEVGGKALLGHAVDRLLAAGADGIIVNVHHFPEQIVDYLRSSYPDKNIEISDETPLLLETGGALAKIGKESKILSASPDDEPVIVTNADVITDMPLDGMIEAHSRLRPFSTILVNPKRESTRKLLFDKDSRLRAWVNLTTGDTRPADTDITNYSQAAFGCVHIMNVSSIRKIAADQATPVRPFGIIDYYLDNCENLNIHAYSPACEYRWHDIGTEAKLEAARADFS